MNDDVSHKLDCDAGSIGYVNVGPTTINGLEAVHDQFLLQLNHHIPLEDNPERLVLNDRMAQSTWFWVNRVIVTGVSDNIEAAITTPDCISSKTNATVCKTLAVFLPVGITAPAVINGIAGST